MHVVYYRQRANLKATIFIFHCFITSLHIVQVLDNGYNILFVSTLRQNVFCPLWYAGFAGANSEHMITAGARSLCLKMNRHTGLIPSGCDVDSHCAGALCNYILPHSPFLFLLSTRELQVTTRNLPGTARDWKSYSQNCYFISSVLLNLYYGRETITSDISLLGIKVCFEMVIYEWKKALS